MTYYYNHLEAVILEEELVTSAADCHKIALSTFRKLVKEQNAKPQASKLLCFGGEDRSTKVTVVYDLNNETSVVNYTDLPEKIQRHCSLLLNRYIYCIGDDVENRVFYEETDRVWRINSRNQTSGWKQVASMNSKRCEISAAVHGDLIVVAGGADENGYLVSSAEVYQTSFNEWRTISSLKLERSGHALVSCDGCLFAIGGWDGNCLSSVELLGNLSEEWINIQSTQTPRYSLAAVNCDGVVYAIGGRFGNDISTTLKTVEKYESSENNWKFVSDMNFERSAHAACVLRNKIYVVGGLDADGKVVTQIECYDPTYNTWSIVGNTTEKLYNHTLVAVE